MIVDFESIFLCYLVSGHVDPGNLLGIMGASGAGKSTLLNALTFRNLSGLDVSEGGRYANGVLVNPTSLTSVSGYVQQDDLFIGIKRDKTSVGSHRIGPFFHFILIFFYLSVFSFYVIGHVIGFF